MVLRGTGPESYVTEHTLVYEDSRNEDHAPPSGPAVGLAPALSQEPCSLPEAIPQAQLPYFLSIRRLNCMVVQALLASAKGRASAPDGVSYNTLMQICAAVQPAFVPTYR